MKVYGDLMEHGEVVPHPTVTEEGDELARRFIHSGVTARGLGRTCGGRSDQKSSCHTFTSNQNIRARYYPGKRAETATRGRYLRPADLIGPHGRSSWWVRFGGRAYFTCEESRQTKRIAWASMRGGSWTSCSGQPKRYQKTTRT